MRALVAMVFAFAAACGATLFLSHNIADHAVAANLFTVPGDVAAFHALVYMGVSTLALVAGWIAGWVIATPLRRKPPPAP